MMLPSLYISATHHMGYTIGYTMLYNPSHRIYIAWESNVCLQRIMTEVHVTLNRVQDIFRARLFLGSKKVPPGGDFFFGSKILSSTFHRRGELFFQP